MAGYITRGNCIYGDYMVDQPLREFCINIVLKPLRSGQIVLGLPVAILGFHPLQKLLMGLPVLRSRRKLVLFHIFLFQIKVIQCIRQQAI